MRIAVVAAMSLLGCGQFLELDDFRDAPPPSGVGGQSAASSSAGGQSASSSGGGGSSSNCPTALFGPALVEVADYCMDQTEVTEGQYRAWLDTAPRTDMQPAYCSTNITFWNAAREQPDPGSTLPVVLVDWCDALAFCTAAGKRLCSRVGGGGLAYVLRGPIDSLESEWFVACTNQGATRFPYGDIYDAELCNGMDAPGDMRVAVGDLPGCRSTSGIVHLSGNVYEWEDACDGMTGASDSCHRRGGSYRSLEDNMSCDGNDSVNFTRLDDTGDTTGIRCCADLK